MSFKINFNSFACEGDSISCNVNGFDVTARLYRDDDSTRPDKRSDGFWPSLDPGNAGYIGNKSRAELDAELAKMRRILQAWKDDKWFYCGVDVTVKRHGVQLTRQYQHALWGIECNYPDTDKSYLTEVANELLQEALVDARDVLAKLRKD